MCGRRRSVRSSVERFLTAAGGACTAASMALQGTSAHSRRRSAGDCENERRGAGNGTETATLSSCQQQHHWHGAQHATRCLHASQPGQGAPLTYLSGCRRSSSDVAVVVVADDGLIRTPWRRQSVLDGSARVPRTHRRTPSRILRQPGIRAHRRIYAASTSITHPVVDESRTVDCEVWVTDPSPVHMRYWGTDLWIHPRDAPQSSVMIVAFTTPLKWLKCVEKYRKRHLSR